MDGTHTHTHIELTMYMTAIAYSMVVLPSLLFTGDISFRRTFSKAPPYKCIILSKNMVAFPYIPSSEVIITSFSYLRIRKTVSAVEHFFPDVLLIQLHWVNSFQTFWSEPTNATKQCLISSDFPTDLGVTFLFSINNFILLT